MRRRLSTAKVLVAGIVGALLVSMLLAPAASSVAPVPAAGVPTAPATSIDSADPVATPTSSAIGSPADPLAQALSRSRPIDLRADDPDLTVIAGLKRDSTALDIRATKASNPDEIEYRDFMSLSEAGQAYGASAATLKKLRSAAKRAGVRVQVDPSRLLARFTAPVSVWEKLYDSKGRVSQPTATYPYRVYSIVKDKQIAGAPAIFKGLVSEWAAIYIQYVASADVPGVDPQQKTDLQELAASAGSPLAWPTNTGTLPPGTCDAKVLRDKAVFAPAQIRKAYRSTSLSARGMRGAGTSLTVLSLGGGFAQADLDRAAACFGYKQPPVSIALGTGLAEPFVNATIETHLDLITVSSVMPEAETIRLVEVSEAQISFIDGIARALNVDGKGTDSPDVVSISYGMCESQLVPYMQPYLALSEDLLRMAALVGTSVIAAAGDYGSSMCGAQEALEVGPTVWYPASSPWATAMGGTRLEITADNTRANEVVWNDYPFVGGPAATPPTAAGGGGPSSLFARPWYQGGSTPAGPRAVPDVALLGAMRPGWPIVYGDQVFTVGGTSGGTPFLGANLALMAAQQSIDGYPGFGFVNPWLYKAAAKTPSPFYDVTIGANSVQMIGCCSAYAGYDMASGLGVPMMDALFKSIPYPAG